jgi:DNA polymerase
MDKSLLLEELAKKIGDCKRCGLWKGTNNAVPGEGDSDSQVLFVGEGPGFHEDKMGRPFVGQAGKLLDKLLALVGLSRKEVFIANVIKHRPPENRDPLPSEITACRYWLDQQLEIIKPKIVVTLGRYSLARFLLNAKISEVHGQPVKVKHQVMVPMYHPAAALRSRVVMDRLSADFQKNAKILRNPNKISEVQELKGTEDDPNQMSFFSSV